MECDTYSVAKLGVIRDITRRAQVSKHHGKTAPTYTRVITTVVTPTELMRYPPEEIVGSGSLIPSR